MNDSAKAFATLYEHQDKQFIGQWWPNRECMMAARRCELAVDPRTRAIATIKGVAR